MLILEECISNDKALHLNALRVYKQQFVIM